MYTNLIVALVISFSTSGFIATAYPFVGSAWLFKLKGVNLIKKPLLWILSVKPFNCYTCLPLWVSIIYTICVDYNFSYYILTAPVMGEAIKRWLLDPWR